MTKAAPPPLVPSAPAVIVPFAARHRAAWRRLIFEWLERDFTIEPVDQQMADDPDGVILAPGGRILIAETDAGVLGCCALMPMPDGGLRMTKLVVDPAAQGQGLGRRLLEATVAEATAMGAWRVFLETNSKQRTAVSMYERSGFVHLPPEPTPFDRCNVWMEKRL